MRSMSTHDGLHERGRALEEEYFRRKDQELIARLRAKAASDAEQRALGASAGVTDPEVLHELQALGFTPDTVPLLPLMPVLQVAWAEGGVTPVERMLIENLATARGIAPGSPADAQLMDWLANKPSDEVLAGATRLIRALLDSGADVVADLTADDLVDHCEKVAAASGGIFGLIGRVSAEEKALLGSIADALKGRRA
jgi:hypothetical protein